MSESFLGKLATFASAGIVAVALAGCESGPPANKQTAGTILGGIGGAVVGSQFGSGTGRLVGVAAGTLLGAYLGSEIGKSLDKADMAAMERTNTRALESGRTGEVQSWRNPDTGHSGSITPVKTVSRADGQPCREYQQTITVGGKTEQAYGTACRQPDGSWKVVN